MIIPAAGQARRFGSGENKVWAFLKGRTVLEWTLAAFQEHPSIEAIIVVANPEEVTRVRSATTAFSKVVAVASGGRTRSASVRNGLDLTPAYCDIVLVHDAARPLISAVVIDRVIEATILSGAAIPGLPLSDTVKRVNADGAVCATVPRQTVVDQQTISGLTAIQTPQGARVALLQAAYAHFDFDSAEPTDEASLVEALGEPVVVVPGDASNLKITRPEDLVMAEALSVNLLASYPISNSPVSNSPVFNSSVSSSNVSSSSVSLLKSNTGSNKESNFMEFRTGFGYDVHAFALPEAGRKLFLGGVEIPHDRGLEGHSDADVMLHAVCDALLGAASLGDIGLLFPNTDDAYKGISSLRLLAVVNARLAEIGWRVVNIDATLVAEAPKLLPHRAAIQRAIGECLSLEPERISVKATTAEKLGFVGRREGIECSAVATISRTD